MSSSLAPFSKAGPAPEKAAAAFTKAHPKETPKASVQVGWAQGRLMYETLNKACENEDLSREGIVKAFHELSALDLEGLTAGPLDYTQLGEPSSTATHITQPAEAPGGLKVLEIVEGGDAT